MKTALTDRQAAAFAYLVAFLLEHHRQPTFREMAADNGWKSPHAASVYVDVLMKKGWLEPGRQTGADGNIGRWKFAGLELSLRDKEGRQP